MRIKLFYAKDFRALLLKYGRIDVGALRSSALEGQAGPVAAPARRREPSPAEAVAGASAGRGQPPSPVPRRRVTAAPRSPLPALTRA